MKTSIPRLHSARLKSGGATLRVFKNKDAANMCDDFKESVNGHLDKRSTDMDGYAIVSWSKDGCVSTSLRINSGRWVGQTEVPDFVRMALLTHVCSG